MLKRRTPSSFVLKALSDGAKPFAESKDGKAVVWIHFGRVIVVVNGNAFELSEYVEGHFGLQSHLMFVLESLTKFVESEIRRKPENSYERSR